MATERTKTSTTRSDRSGRRAQAERNDVSVLAAARDVFIELGWDAPVSAVAARAGVGMGSIYRRYPSKTDLLRAMCLGAMDRAAEEARDALAGEPDGWQALRRFMRRMVEARSCALFVLIGNSATVGGEIEDGATDLRGAIDELVAAAHDCGALRPEVVATDIYLLLAHLRSTPDSTPERAEQLQLRYLDVVLQGIAAPGTQPRATLAGPPPSWAEVVFADAPDLHPGGAAGSTPASDPSGSASTRTPRRSG
ncbi:AcrR family transcriptional regulator [Frankia sp. AiPs1]|uniref:TetR/AcrR family transcriptional regulator n=1 Tax=Frankia sp. AiPa1 TaxID=573492 RepID=UPI00202B0BDF|nr:TetR/AcrR family transcriptional regulator [Frankia sp. AiPa1]MCL9760521.1 TetR/AcrR family transcriptional regulator [Frankia sp. AiPa1]